MSFLCTYCDSVLNSGASFCVVCSRPVKNDGFDGKLVVKHRTKVANQTLRLNQLELPQKINYKKLRQDYTIHRSLHEFANYLYPLILVLFAGGFFIYHIKSQNIDTKKLIPKNLNNVIPISTQEKMHREIETTLNSKSNKIKSKSINNRKKRHHR